MKQKNDLKALQKTVWEKIAPDFKRTKPVAGAFQQWLYWLSWTLLVGVGLAFFARISLRDISGFLESRAVLYAGLYFAAAALAAWLAICTSLPGRLGRTLLFERLEGIFLALVVLVPLGGFPFSRLSDWKWVFSEGRECSLAVWIIGCLPWLAMGFRLSRNAAFCAWKTGFWASVSAFFSAGGWVSFFCLNRSIEHLLSSHLFPIALAVLFFAFLGKRWLSRWRG